MAAVSASARRAPGRGPSRARRTGPSRTRSARRARAARGCGSAAPVTCGWRPISVDARRRSPPAVAVAQRAVRDGEDDGGGVARLRREALDEEVVRALGLRARREKSSVKPVPVARAARRAPRARRRRRGRALPVVGGGAGEAPEEEGHASVIAHSCKYATTALLHGMLSCAECHEHGLQWRAWHGAGSAGAQEAAHARGDRPARAGAVRRARLRPRDDRRDRGRRRHRAPHLLRLLPLQGGRRLPRLRGLLRVAARAAGDARGGREHARRPPRLDRGRARGDGPRVPRGAVPPPRDRRLAGAAGARPRADQPLRGELADGMAADLGEPEDSLRVRMVVAAAAAALAGASSASSTRTPGFPRTRWP